MKEVKRSCTGYGKHSADPRREETLRHEDREGTKRGIDGTCGDNLLGSSAGRRSLALPGRKVLGRARDKLLSREKRGACGRPVSHFYLRLQCKLYMPPSTSRTPYPKSMNPRTIDNGGASIQIVTKAHTLETHKFSENAPNHSLYFFSKS